MGRIPKHPEGTTAKFTTILLQHHVGFLQRLGADAMERAHSRLQGAELIRAFLDALSDSKIDLVDCVEMSNPQTREDNLRVFFLHKLRR